MPIVHLIGPNAIGKTTAVRRWADRFGSMMVPVSLDLLRKPGYDTVQEKQQRCTEWSQSDVESARSSQIAVVSCDGGVVWTGGEEQRESSWKGKDQDRKTAVELIREHHAISICESARTATTTKYAVPDDPVIVVICAWDTLGKHLRTRCATKGKRFRDDYWDQRKLEYESSQRYLNFARKYLAADQYRVFEVNDQARDWVAVDQYFAGLFQKLYNRLVRQSRR